MWEIIRGHSLCYTKFIFFCFRYQRCHNLCNNLKITETIFSSKIKFTLQVSNTVQWRGRACAPAYITKYSLVMLYTHESHLFGFFFLRDTQRSCLPPFFSRYIMGWNPLLNFFFIKRKSRACSCSIIYLCEIYCFKSEFQSPLLFAHNVHQSTHIFLVTIIMK